MNEKKKLREAVYFYSKMEEEKNREAFCYNLSAFLSSARSILQYALEEAKCKPGGKTWYEGHISASPVLKFFKDKRDVNIHTEPVAPKEIHSINIQLSVPPVPTVSVSCVVRDKSGNIIQETQSANSEKQAKTNLKPSENSAQVRHELKYRFDDWTGQEDVLTLCQMYIHQLDAIVENGIAKNVITG